MYQFDGLGFLGQFAAEQKAWSTADGQAAAVYELPDRLEKKFKPYYLAAEGAWKALPTTPSSALAVTAYIKKSLWLVTGGDFSFLEIEGEYDRAEEADDFDLQTLLSEFDVGLSAMVSLIETVAARPKTPVPAPVSAPARKPAPANGAVLSAEELVRLARQRRGLAPGAPKGGVLTERQQFELMMAARKRSEPGVGTAVGVVVFGLGLLGLAWAFRRRR